MIDLKGNLSDIRRIQVTVAHDQKSIYQNERWINSKKENEFIHLFELRKTAFPIAEALASISKHYGDDLQDIKIN